MDAELVALEADRHILVTKATAIIVASDEDYELAGEFLVGVAGFKKRIGDKLDGPVKKAHEAHRAMTSLRNELTGPCDKASTLVKGKMREYAQAQQRKEQEERRRLEAEAREHERKRQEAEAEALDAEGRTEEAIEILDTPIVVAPLAPAIAQPTAKGVSMRANWKHRVTDARRIPREFLMPDDRKLAAHAKSFRDTMKMDGVIFYDAGSVSVRSK